MIRVVTLDRQPLMRLGLAAALAAQRYVLELGAAAEERELWPLLYRADPHARSVMRRAPRGPRRASRRRA